MNKECRACSKDRICNPATGRCVLKTGEIGRKIAREPLSAEDDPYSLKRYPVKYQIVIGKQAHNARQLVKAAQAKGAYLNMYRQPLTPAQIERLKVLVPHELARRNSVARRIDFDTSIARELDEQARNEVHELERRVRNARARVVQQDANMLATGRVFSETGRFFSVAGTALRRAERDLARASLLVRWRENTAPSD